MTAIGPKECPKANVLNAMPKSVQPKAKAHLKDIWMAETKAEADTAFDYFAEACGVKYAKSCSKWRAAKCLTKDRADLLAFYAFPAGHWKHIRTSDPIKSTFATVRHPTTAYSTEEGHLFHAIAGTHSTASRAAIPCEGGHLV